MGYIIRKCQSKRRTWRIQFISRANGIQKAVNVKESDLLSLGFRPDMPMDEVVARKNQLNAHEHLKRHEKRRITILSKIKEENVVNTAFLGAHFIQEFEQDNIFRRAGANKFMTHWRKAQHVIVTLKLEPQLWYKNRTLFYDYFSSNGYSLSYMQKILFMLNKWGEFVTDKSDVKFKNIPFPAGVERSRVADPYFEKYGNGNASAPISPLQLESKRSDLSQAHYNWLYLSIWLGLRPPEVDLLLKASAENTWQLKNNVLWVYQSKLTGIPREQRTKPIPLMRAEQLFTISVIQNGNFKRPLVKTVKRLFGPNVNLYAGRKGFTDMMLGYGYRLEDISIWMGHRSIERTWRSYKNKQTFRKNLQD